MNYIKLPGVFEKLKKAEETYSPVIMTAAHGFGKSAAVNYYYRRKNPLIIRCGRPDGKLSEMPDIGSIRSNVVIIENMQWLTDEAGIQYLKGLLSSQGRQIIMLTRGAVPAFLAPQTLELGIVRIQEADFRFSEDEVRKLFKENGAEIHPDDVAKVTQASAGYICALHYYIQHMEHGERYSDEICEAVWQDMFHFWDGYVFEQWSQEFINFALAICPYDEFTVDMAEYLTGNRNSRQIIEYCRSKTNQLHYRAGGNYSIRYEVRRYYAWKRDLTWSREEIAENFKKAAQYYEQNGDIRDALRFYKKAGATEKVTALLIQNANTHPGIGHYVDTKEYYLDLSKEEIRESPVLMAGMCMLCDLILEPQLSEEWYHELLDYERDRQNPQKKRSEAKMRLAYLDIALPHRGVKGILRIMHGVLVLMQDENITLPEFAATGNMPSIMNGGLDFCEWSKNDTQIAKFMKKPLEVILGRYGKGLVTIALAESGFEKGTMTPYEVMTRCGDGYEAALHGGKIEMCFVSVAIRVRQHLVEGQLPSARRLFGRKSGPPGPESGCPRYMAVAV